MGIIMKQVLKPSAVKALAKARAVVADVTPLKINCGKRCGSACCQPDESGENGMLLFPYEDTFYQKPIDGFLFHLVPDDTLVKGGKRLVCEGVCVREHRPLACRIFPLRIRIEVEEETGETVAVPEIDPRAWCVCPLLEMGGLRAMSGDFIRAVGEAGKVLARNTTLLEALYNEQRLLDDMRRL